jgi:outer membrane beta-barrel protein
MTAPHVVRRMRVSVLASICLLAAGACLLAAPAARADATDSADTITAVQKRPLRQAQRLEISPYGEMSIGDPYLQRWGAGLRAMWHLREGLSIGLDGNGLGTWATQELVIAKRELHARILESRQRMSLAAFAAIAPLYGKVALPGDAIVHFETFLDAGLGAAWTETDATRGVRPMVALGIGQRVFLGENAALTARVGGNLYAEQVMVDGSPQTKAMGFWTVRLGLSFYFGGGQ